MGTTSDGRIAIALAALLAAGLGPAAFAGATPGLARVWDVAQRAGRPGQLVAYNPDVQGSAYGMPVAAGNLNGADGDGMLREDVVLAPFNAPAGPRRGAGKLQVYFGRPSIAGTADPSDRGAAGGLEIWGAREGDFLGNEVAVADVTGDGLDDLLAGAQNADGFNASNSRPQAGALYVVAGRENWPGRIDLADTSAADGVIQILGVRGSDNPGSSTPDPGDRFGFWVSAGDVDGDGTSDILVSADLSDGPGRSKENRGALYVIPGGDNLREPGGALRRTIDLASPGDVAVFAIYGVDANDHFGSAIASDDFDGDGYDDVITSAGANRAGMAWAGFNQAAGVPPGGGDGPPGDNRVNAGEAYVIYGRPRAAWEAAPSLELDETPDDGYSIYYLIDEQGFAGEEVSSGDLDGDGRPELLVGALLASPPGRSHGGEGYVFWGHSLARGEAVDAKLARDTPRLTILYGERAADIGADTLRAADLDGDGYDDLLFASPNNDCSGSGDTRPGAGDLKVLFGSAAGLPPLVDFADPPEGTTAFQVVAADLGDMLAYSLDTGDFDGDGHPDILSNAMGGDGRGNAVPNAGELNVISGRSFSQAAGRLGGVPPTLRKYKASPATGPYFAGASGLVITLKGEGFAPGAVVYLEGVGPLPAEAVTVVNATTIRVRLDAAPAARAHVGPLVFRVGNAGGDPSEPLETVTLVGPVISGVRVETANAGLVLRISGSGFAAGGMVTVTDASGASVPVTKVRVLGAKARATIAAGAVPPGSVLTVRVVNPGGVASEPFGVAAP